MAVINYVLLPMPFHEGHPPSIGPEGESNVDEFVESLDDLRRARDPFESQYTREELRAREEVLTARMEEFMKSHALSDEEGHDLMGAIYRFLFDVDPNVVQVTKRLDIIYRELDTRMRR